MASVPVGSPLPGATRVLGLETPATGAPDRGFQRRAARESVEESAHGVGRLARGGAGEEAAHEPSARWVASRRDRIRSASSRSPLC
jgi:hypothetical protein